MINFARFCTKSTPPHVPVMLKQVVDHLDLKPNQILLDMTFGSGGHSRKLLDSVENLKIIALDRDPVAHNHAVNLSREFPQQIIPILGKFSELPQQLKRLNFNKNSLDGILIDCGCSSMQFDDGKRGFSLSKTGPLDMRMDGSRIENQPTAADVLARATENDLYKIVKVYGEEKRAKKIARRIVESRYLFKKLTTTEELAALVDSCFEDTEQFRTDKLHRFSHNATRTFQALRIFVNNELNEINYALILANRYLKINGRLITLTFHSLEDKIVKRHLMGNVMENVANELPLRYSGHESNSEGSIFHELMEKNWKMLHKHVLTPRPDEVESNPRSRSAKFRAAIKIK